MPVIQSKAVHELGMGRDLDETMSSNIECMKYVEEVIPDVESSIMYRGWVIEKDPEMHIKDKLFTRNKVIDVSDTFLGKCCRFKSF